MSLLVETSPIRSPGDPSLRALYEARDGVVLPDTQPVAAIDRTNPLAWEDSATRIAELGRTASNVVISSGTLADEPDAPEPRNWLGPGRRQLDEWVDRVTPALDSGDLRLWIEPDSRGILSDTQSTLNFLRERLDDRLGIALHPARLLEWSMFGELEDHLVRIFDSLAERAAVVYLTGFEAPVNDRSRVRGVQLGTGALDAERIIAIAREYSPASTRFAVVDFDSDSVAEQMTLLRQYDLA